MPGLLPSGPRRDSGSGLRQTEACAPRRIETPANWEALIPEGKRETSFSELCRWPSQHCQATHEPASAGSGQNPASAASSPDVRVRKRERPGAIVMERLTEGDDARGPDHPLRPHLLKPSATDQSCHQQPQCDWAGEAHARRQWAATYGFGAGRPASSRTRREKRSIDLRAETTSAGRTSKGIA